MSSVIKVNACVYSRLGYGREENTNSFYMNGKFNSEQHIDNVQAAMENRGAEYLFAVADNMNCTDEDSETNIAILKEIGRYHEKITVNGGDLKFKIKELESRVGDSERLIASFLEMNRIPIGDARWGLGFGGLLLSDGQFVAVTSGNCKIYMMRDGMFRPLAAETSKAKRLIDAKVHEEELDSDDIVLPDEDPNSSLVISDIYDVAEGDSFILVSDGLINAIGEEKAEDLLSLRSDSAYIAFRLVDEAMKRKTSGDLTAMVIQVERIYEGASSPKRAAKPDNMKNRVDKLNKAPSVTYKYNRKKSSKYQGTLYLVLVAFTVLAVFGIIYIIINSMINPGDKKPPKDSPVVTATATPTSTPIESIEPTEEPTIEPTPEPTPDPASVSSHVVAKGDTMNTIARKYYGSDAYAKKLCDYNGIANANLIQIGQKIKIPPKEELQ